MACKEYSLKRSLAQFSSWFNKVRRSQLRLPGKKGLFALLMLTSVCNLYYYGRRVGAWRRIGGPLDLTPELDRTGEYMIIGPLRDIDSPAPAGSGGDKLVLITHCTLSKAHELYNLLETWNGPASLAVFVSAGDDVDRLLRALQLLLACRGDHGLSAYIVYPVAASIVVKAIDGDEGDVVDEELAPCGSLLNELQKLSRDAGATLRNYEGRDGSSYPGNFLRNVALQPVRRDDYVLVLDVDMVPSTELYVGLLRFLVAERGRIRGAEERVAYVVPSFESKHGKGVSFDRATLQRLWRLGLVRPFYIEACPQCQSTTQYERWIGMHDDAVGEPMGDVRAAYSATRRLSDAWEPFFVARKSELPPYDERFKQYGYNRISQVCEMHMMGFRFVVLDNAFLVHKGFKTEASFHASKNAEQANNTKLYRQFRWEMKERYPSRHEC